MQQNSNNQASDQMVKDWFAGTTNVSSPDSLSHTLGSLFQVIRENRWGILVLMILGCIAGVFKALSETPVYQARLIMAVEPTVYRASSQSVFDPFAFRFYETQYELLKSRSVAERVVDRLDLVEEDAVQALLIPPSILHTLAQEIADLTGVRLIKEVQPEPTRSKQLSPDEAAQKKAWLTSIIQGGVSVSGGEKTNLVEVTFNSVNPEFAAKIANALVNAYIEQGLDSQLNRSQQTSQWLSQRIDDLKTQLDGAQKNLQDFLVQEDMLDSSRNNQITTSELQSLNQEYVAARSKFDELAKRYGARHPKISEARSEVNAAKARLERKSRIISSSREKQVELDRLERDVDVNQELYEAFLSKFKEADLSSSATKVASARIIDKALAPSGPIYPHPFYANSSIQPSKMVVWLRKN